MTGESQSGAEPRSPDARDATAPLVAGRSCGTCSLCCKLYPVQELNKPAGQWCSHSVRGGGCGIHSNRPQACREFFCSWRLDPNLGPEWKPEVSRFVLSADRGWQALIVMLDPGMPLAWKREPYYARLKQMSEIAFRHHTKILVNLRGHITVILPDRDVPIGMTAPGEDIVIWREGLAYGAMLRRDLEPAKSAATRGSSGRLEPRPADPGLGKPGCAPTPDDPDLTRTVFREAFAHACGLLDDPKIDDREALTATIRRRNKMLDETADAYAKAGGAECKAGCVSCCYLMVMATPFEILSIARHLLETKTPAAIEGIKARLQRVSEIPLDPLLRVKAKVPCGLLEDGRCAAYEQRPSVCRMTLSQSRAACDSCLKDAAGSIPYIEQPSKVAAVMQAGIDHALITRRNLSIEGAELSRALLIALRDHEGALTNWLAGRDPFPGAHFSAEGTRSDRERAIAAAARFGAV